MTQAPVKNTYPRDVFMHLLSTVALYWSVWSVLALIFACINLWIKDTLDYYVSPASMINWPLATLIILFPVYLWTVWFLNRDLAAHPEKNEYRIRRWLLYLNVFLSAMLLIGDAVALIYGFLNGDLTVRFLWKAFAVFVVGAVVLAYYFFDLQRQPADRSALRWWRYGSMLAVVLLAATSLLAAGSPFRQRLVRFDEQKVWNLQSIQSQLITHWSLKERLPASLAELNDPISGFMVPQDAQTGQEYKYEPTGELSFELCANFNLESARPPAAEMYPHGKDWDNNNWIHSAGWNCFKRTIDPDLYGNRIEQPKPVR